MNIVAALLIGLGLGLFHFGALWFSVQRVLRGSPHRWLLTPGAVARFAALGLALAALARAGAGVLLGGLTGLWIARTALVCLVGGLRDEA